MKYKIKIILILGVFIIFSTIIILLTTKTSKHQQINTQREVANNTSRANDFEDKNKNKSPKQWKEINSDFQFILEIENKQVPVVKAEDNNKYLHTNIYNENDFYGVPYLDYQNSIDDDNLIVYGHSSSKKDLVFSFIKYYQDKEYFNKELKLIDLEGNTNYFKPIALIKIDQNNPNVYMGFLNLDYQKTDAKTYLNEIKKYASVENIENIEESKLLTLITCNLEGEDDNQRFAMIFKKQ